jgi:uncharacterized lipoprotein YajG
MSTLTKRSLQSGFILSFTLLLADCGRPRNGLRSSPDTAPPSAARASPGSVFSDTVTYRRVCVVAPDSAVDLRRPCVPRDQGVRWP